MVILPVDKLFGGTALRQRIWRKGAVRRPMAAMALARSYYWQRPLLFLDEPTAAIDPLEEMALYGKLCTADRAERSFSSYLAGADQVVSRDRGKKTVNEDLTLVQMMGLRAMVMIEAVWQKR